MVVWTIQYHPEVADDFEKNVALKDREYLYEQIQKRLTIEPDKIGKPLGRDLSGYRRMRVSKYRIVYKVLSKIVTVYVLTVDKREDVYDEVLKRLGLV